jgi:hypothetical protein
MRKQAITSSLILFFAVAPIMVGCEKKLAENETVHTNADGSVTKDSTTVTQQPDGSVVKTQDQSKTPANNNP